MSYVCPRSTKSERERESWAYLYLVTFLLIVDNVDGFLDFTQHEIAMAVVGLDRRVSRLGQERSDITIA